MELRMRQMLAAVLTLILLAPAGLPEAGAAQKKGATPPKAPRTVKVEPVPGFADLHTHQFGHLAAGGAWLHGEPDGPQSQALTPCNMNFLHAMTALMGRPAHVQTVQGHPSFRDWPAWGDVSHQQVHADWLRQAHQGGLTLLVMSAQNFEPFCRLVNVATGRFDPKNPESLESLFELCDDMGSVTRQLQAAHDFEAAHGDWYQIVETPQEARSAIRNGKLAVVLAVEVSNLFPSRHGSWQSQLQEMWDLGVRSIQPVHELNNRFGGAAIHDPAFRAFEALKSHAALGTKDYSWATERMQIAHDGKVLDTDGFERVARGPDTGLNVMGLTADGRALVEEMMSRNMLIDISHMSERASRETLSLAEQNAWYPIFTSHTYFRELMTPDQKDWTKHVPASLISRIKGTGGMVGLRTGPKEMLGYRGGSVDNSCHGSSRTFAQQFEYATLALGVEAGFATDYNGMIDQMQPRFTSKNDACSAAYRHCSGKLTGQCSDYRKERDAQQIVQGSAGSDGTGTSFDDKGLAHIGLLPQVRHDLAGMGANVAPIDRSSEAFIRMWERAYASNRGRLDANVQIATNFSLVNGDMPDSWYLANQIQPYADKAERRAWADAAMQTCSVDTDCGPDSFCKSGNPKRCQRKLNDGTPCLGARQCAGGACEVRCYTPNSKAMDEACRLNAECIEGKCSAELWGLINGKCVCENDGDCGSDEWCFRGFADIGTNECRPLRDLGESCNVNRECRRGKCSAELWGVINGRCVCDSNDDCGSNQWCYRGFADIGTNQCRTLKQDGQTCTSGNQCSSGRCNVVCYTPNSKNMGQSCNVNAECRDGKCSAELWGLVNGRCVCENDADCANGFCHKGFATIGTNECRSFKPLGQSCSRGGQCRSGCCKMHNLKVQCRPSDKCN